MANVTPPLLAKQVNDNELRISSTREDEWIQSDAVMEVEN